MSGRTTRFRTVVLALLCVVSLLAAPATAVATPENPFGGDGTDSTTAGDEIGDTLDGSSDTSSDGSSDTSDSTDDSSDTDTGSGSDGSSDTDESDTSDSSSEPESPSEPDDSGSTDTDSTSDDADSSSEDSSLRSALAAGVNTTVGTTDTVADATEPTSRSSSDDREAADTEDATTDVDWSALDATLGSTLAVEDDSDPTLGTGWYESSLSRTTDGTTTRTGSLSGTLGGVTGNVLAGLDGVVDVGTVGSLSTTDTGVDDTRAGLAESTTRTASGPADAGGEAERNALVPADGIVDTGAGLRVASGAPLGSSPATGFALSLGGVTALAAVRQGLFAATGTGVTGAASTLAASVTPALVGRSSALDRLVRMLTAFRYSRYDDSDPLEHEARADVFDVVEETPGAYLSEVAERADLPLSTARHHVRVLEREDLLTGAKVRGKRRFYPAYTGDMELAAALNDDATAVVLDALSRLGGSSVSELADELGRDPSTVTHHLQRLEEDDIVVREREGRAVINRLSAEARTALEPEAEAPARAEASGAVASD